MILTILLKGYLIVFEYGVDRIMFDLQSINHPKQMEHGN